MKQPDRTVLYPWELGEDDLRALAASEAPAAAAQFDHETHPGGAPDPVPGRVID